MNESTMWGIHAGLGGEVDSLFRHRNVIAVGWPAIGDLSKLQANRESFKNAVAQAYPGTKAGAVVIQGGLLFRFVHEIRKGDLVVYPSKHDREIHIGRVTGDYQYDNAGESAYPNRRSVTWLKSWPRTRFTQGALYEIGSAMTLFQVKNYADEFRTALEGTPSPPTVQADPSVSLIAEDIEETTHDFIIKTLAQELKGHPLEDFVGHLLNAMGYHTRVTTEGPDGGVDIIAHRDELGFDPPKIKVQVKATAGSIGEPMLPALYGKVGPQEHGLLVTLGTFTAQARAFAREKSNLRLIDGEELVELILDHYEQFDSKYKGILPLKRIYVPQLISEEE